MALRENPTNPDGTVNRNAIAVEAFQITTSKGLYTFDASGQIIPRESRFYDPSSTTTPIQDLNNAITELRNKGEYYQNNLRP